MPVTLHESGHIAVMLFSGIQIREITLLPCGLEISAKKMMTYRQETAVALAGPLLGLLFSLFALPFALRGNIPGFSGNIQDKIGLFARNGIMYSVFNMLPMSGLDGYVFISSLLKRKIDITKAERVCGALNAASLALILTLSMAVLIFTRYNISLLLFTAYIFSTALFRKN